ncbi:helix-turn-helix transcriptional regulator [Fischerella sp. PCC 9605]|uniref:helix-turn-helix transcriptional regulator n=1 Tax=Fischerella sp. PCC 9605 TaxID=1173024 RepID=UPI00047E2B1E|nr:AraC family transcriptional regulator [Fischerella sp. PCC 9605]
MLNYCEELTQQKPLLVDFKQEGASRELFLNPPLLTSNNSGWSGIHFEHHYQPSYDTPEHRLTMHTISIAFCAIPSERWFDGRRQREYQTTGTIAIIPAGTLHRCLWQKDVQFMFVAVEPKLLVSLGAEVDAPTDIELIPEFATKQDPLIQGIVLSLKEELGYDRQGSNLYVEQLTTTLIIHLLKKYSVRKPQILNYGDGLPKHKLQQTLEYINVHLDQDIKLADLAGTVGMSQYYFVRLFKQSMGIAPYQYVIQQRVERAKQLLKQGKVTITDIALQCGFANQSHFTKHFRQLTGVTPKTYQQL